MIESRLASPRPKSLQTNPKATLIRPTPFLKWAGGKTRLLPAFLHYFPRSFGRYFEPFLGGGAVYFHLMPSHAVLSDLNAELVNCYEAVRNDVESVIDVLQQHRNDKHHFYAMRKQDLSDLSDVERAARLIFLNKTCFNGLYRVNSKGQFNVPFGRYKNPRICDVSNLRAVSNALKNVVLRCAPFEVMLTQAGRDDFVYLDPPYQPVSRTANFTGYTRSSFRTEDQERLAETFKQLANKGCRVMLSNSDNQYIRSLYTNFRIETVQAARAINCKGDRRGYVSELLVLNY